MRASDTYERVQALRARVADPLRQVVSRQPVHPDHPFYQSELLDCGHTVPNQTPSHRPGKGWVWPTRRRCWQCGKDHSG